MYPLGNTPNSFQQLQASNLVRDGLCSSAGLLQLHHVSTMFLCNHQLPCLSLMLLVSAMTGCLHNTRLDHVFPLRVCRSAWRMRVPMVIAVSLAIGM
jgi:hypothetical protein